MSGIGIITNPHSKLNKRNPKRKALLGYIVGSQGVLEVTESLDDLARVAKEFRQSKISTLAINGGDGTISRTLTAFIKEYGDEPLPQICLLRGGTINVLANNLQVKGTPEQILYRLTEAHSAGLGDEVEIREIDTIQVEGQYGFLFSNGASPRFLAEYYKRKSGPVGAAWWVFRVWLSRFLGGKLYNSVVQDAVQTLKPATPQDFEITHRTCSVFCSTLPQLPLGYPLFRDLKDHPGEFQCVSFTFSARDAVWQLPWVLLRNKRESHNKMSLCTGRLAITTDEPSLYTLDGELFTAKDNTLVIDKGPTLQFVLI